MAIQEAVPLPEHNDWKIKTPYQFAGMTIIIEHMAGDTRTKEKGPAISISSVMPSAYGFIVGTTDAHGEGVDIYLATLPDANADIYVIDQVDPVTKIFDEHKVMLGFASPEEATTVYCCAFNDGSGESRIGDVVCFTPKDFLTWLHQDGATLFAASFSKGTIPAEVLPGQGLFVPPPQPKKPTLDVGGGIIVSMLSAKDGPVFKTTTSEQGIYNYHLYMYTSLMPETWAKVTDAFCRTLDLAGPDDTIHIHLASPGGCVVSMGRIVSAMMATKAKVITYAEGEVCSAATTIWGYGHERHISPTAYFMQHMSSQGIEGKTTDMVVKLTFCQNYINKILVHLKEIGLFTQTEFDEMVNRSSDVFITGVEAIKRVGAVSTTQIR